MPTDAASSIAAACDIERVDVEAIVADAALGGNLVIPLVRRLREAVRPEVAGFVHRGATSQDVVDAATAVIVRRCAARRRHRAALGAVPGGRPAGARRRVVADDRPHARPSTRCRTTFATVTGRWHDGLAAAAGAARPHGTAAGLARRPERRRDVVRPAPRRGHADLRPAPGARRRRRRRPTRSGRGSPTSPARGAPSRRRAPRSRSTSCCSPRTTSARWQSGPRAPVARRRWPTSTTRSRRSRRGPRRCRLPGLVATLLTAAGSGELERAAGRVARRMAGAALAAASHRLGGPLGRRVARARARRHRSDGGEPRRPPGTPQGGTMTNAQLRRRDARAAGGARRRVRRPGDSVRRRSTPTSSAGSPSPHGAGCGRGTRSSTGARARASRSPS